jgi:hypothetical protein
VVALRRTERMKGMDHITTVYLYAGHRRGRRKGIRWRRRKGMEERHGGRA